MDWNTFAVRFTIFPLNNFDYLQIPSLWKSLSLKEIDEYELSINSKNAFSVLEDELDGNSWLIQARNHKIDFLIKEGLGPEINKYGLFSDKSEKLFSPFFNWIDQCDIKVRRIAFAPVLYYPAEDNQQANELFSDELNGLICNKITGTDFMFQINLPIIHKIGESEIEFNRVMNWRTVHQINEKIDLNQLKFMEIKINQVRTLCQLNLDINTSENFHGEFLLENKKEIFVYMHQLAQEIANKGGRLFNE